jgi:predicted Zn-dependent peptidase
MGRPGGDVVGGIMRTWVGALALAAVCAGGTAAAQQVPVEEIVLDNGMRLLLLPRPGDPNVAAGWVAKVGSVYERPGITGVAHLFEHMMFKGTAAIGTRNIEQDLQIIAQLDEVKAALRVEEGALLDAERLGRIEDAGDPAHRTDRHQELMDRFEALLAQQEELLITEDFSRIYSGQGASGMNAGTSYDFTLYFVNVPANKLELWFWMESDRLASPVFREFYAERDVVREERRLRTDSTPTGKLNEQLESMFWQSSPYGWPVIGWPSDLNAITRAEAMEFFDRYYAPNNLVASLVGDFDPEQVKTLARRYFGRLPRGAHPPEAVRTREVEQQAEQRLAGHAETRPQASIRFHTVPDAHVDEPALIVLSAILNGRTGRLYKSLVLEQQVAVQAGAGVDGRKYDGSFQVSGVAAPGSQPEDVEKALLAELELIGREPVGERELQKVKNQQLAGDFRKLQSKFGLMLQLLTYEALGDWRNINIFSDRIQAVTPEDIQRVAKRYFSETNRTVALYYTKEGAGPPGGRRPGRPPQGGRR